MIEEEFLWVGGLWTVRSYPLQGTFYLYLWFNLCEKLQALKTYNHFWIFGLSITSISPLLQRLWWMWVVWNFELDGFSWSQCIYMHAIYAPHTAYTLQMQTSQCVFTGHHFLISLSMLYLFQHFTTLAQENWASKEVIIQSVCLWNG